MKCLTRLQLIKVLVQREGLLCETLAATSGLHNLADLARQVERVALHDLPVVEHALGEGLATSVLAEIGSKA